MRMNRCGKWNRLSSDQAKQEPHVSTFVVSGAGKIKCSQQCNEQPIMTLLSPAGVQIHWCPEPSLIQEVPETPPIKEEQSVKPEEEQLPPFTAVCVKSEEQTVQRQEVNSELEEQTNNSSDSDWEHWEPAASASAAQTETEADGVQIKDTRGTRPFMCSVCEKTFTPDVERHMLTHAGGRPYSCSLTQQNDLDTHMQVHTEVRPDSDLTCPVCQKRFTHNSTIKRHMATHTGDRPYSCSICDATFLRKYYLQVHMRRHTGERPYSCSVCQKSFSQSCNLKTHMVTHTGERPYSCSICQRTFALSNALRVHMITHTDLAALQSNR
uniref:C2H2-type domain-containing protein n=1 Tax=Neogobius melanostomus TaxID=47308 RepID=A0A8C6WRE8_9GOBI